MLVDKMAIGQFVPPVVHIIRLIVRDWYRGFRLLVTVMTEMVLKELRIRTEQNRELLLLAGRMALFRSDRETKSLVKKIV
jgi:hypothetical protein